MCFDLFKVNKAQFYGFLEVIKRQFFLFGERIQTLVFTTLHAQPIKVVTVTEPLVASAVCAALTADKVNAQAAPDCVIV